MGSTFLLPEYVREETGNHTAEVEDYLAGRLSEEMFRSRRVPRGIYQQRQPGLYMVRVRVPGGYLEAEQARQLARVCRQYTGGNLHFTTRQDAQLHGVPIEATPQILEQLLEKRLTSLGGGGNSVRNITTCSHSGTYTGGVFDPLPYAMALTGYLLPRKSSYNLPRKFKIAFSCCPGDGALARVNDLGLISRYRNGEAGFAVYVGGGMGSHSRAGDLFASFLPAGEIIRLTEALIRVFDRHGDRRNRQQARLRFAVERLGVNKFHREVAGEMEDVSREGVPDAVPVGTDNHPLQHQTGQASDDGATLPGYRSWKEKAVLEQKQEGFFSVLLPLKRGDLPAEDLLCAAEIAERFGASLLRVDRRQNLVIPHLAGNSLPEAYRKLQEMTVEVTGESSEPWMVSCKGAETCKLGVCRSQDLNEAISEAFDKEGLPPELFRELDFHVSGCPNNCGQHSAAGLGFFGAVRRSNNRSYPVYNLVANGGNGGQKFNLAETAAMIPARRVPTFTVELLKDFLNSAHRPAGFSAYWEEEGREKALTLADKYSRVPTHEEDPAFYRDWGSEEEFSLSGRTRGECGAGVVELIADELEKSEEAYRRAKNSSENRARKLLEAVSTAAGALLVTRGTEPGHPDTALKEFERRFIEENLASEEHRDLLVLTRAGLRSSKTAEELIDRFEEVSGFLQEVQRLYDEMDASLNFKVKREDETIETAKEIERKAEKEKEAAEKANTAASDTGKESAETGQAHLDLRGVECPMNFVHAKIALEQLPVGSLLEVILDRGEPVENVPASFRDQDQEVISIEPEGSEHYRVLIRRAK